ncbi:flagellar basal body-associated FliL family protein [Ramlibacter sp. MMS24-I3-19]|uniref:flagellar basal body-associated FliL family protein n=1 Tax=Ramlibacter sp. MMS24-I3-19 TaxID=3416606 RepID=UPI003CFD5FC8
MSDAKDQTAPKKSSKKLVVIVLATLLLAGGGGGYWWFSHRGGEGDDEEAVAQAAARKKHGKPLFTTLEPFTVNLQDPRGERFAQVGVTLQFSDAHVEETIKDHLPAIRNEVLMLISSKQIEELITVDGKKQLAEQIRTRAALAMGVELPKEAEAPEPAPKKVAKDEEQADDEAEDEPKPKKKKKKKAKAAVENPIEQVLFSQFIVQ